MACQRASRSLPTVRSESRDAGHQGEQHGTRVSGEQSGDPAHVGQPAVETDDRLGVLPPQSENGRGSRVDENQKTCSRGTPRSPRPRRRVPGQVRAAARSAVATSAVGVPDGGHGVLLSADGPFRPGPAYRPGVRHTVAAEFLCFL